MKAVTVKLPDSLAASIAAEAKRLGVSKSDVIRDRLRRAEPEPSDGSHLDAIAHLIGSVVDDLPADLSSRVDYYLKKTGFGRDNS